MIDSDDNTRTQRLTAIAVGLAIVCLVICLTTWFQVSGYSYGMFYGVFSDSPASGFAIHAPDYYQSINSWYFFISVCLAVFLLGKLLGRSLLAVIVRVLAICISTFPFFNMLIYKFAVLSSRKEWLETSIYMDCVCLILIASIVGIEILVYISHNG